jgi:hypothetical protein
MEAFRNGERSRSPRRIVLDRKSRKLEQVALAATLPIRLEVLVVAGLPLMVVEVVVAALIEAEVEEVAEPLLMDRARRLFQSRLLPLRLLHGIQLRLRMRLAQERIKLLPVQKRLLELRTARLRKAGVQQLLELPPLLFKPRPL